jgi:hypothetical protein
MQEIVIKIPEDDYRKVQDGRVSVAMMRTAIRNGTVLPKGHGRMIDESQITGTFTWDNGYIECFAPTIIEADRSEE